MNAKDDIRGDDGLVLCIMGHAGYVYDIHFTSRNETISLRKKAGHMLMQFILTDEAFLGLTNYQT